MFHVYKNGNYTVLIDKASGTKIRRTEDDEFLPEFPESIDISIGRRCDGGCQYCYERATPDGPEGDLLDAKFIDSLHPYTEIAINGNSVNHVQLIPFLERLKEKKVIVNMTVNQIHFERKEDVIADLMYRDLITGLGISLRKPTEEFIEKVRKYPTAVIHVISGCVTMDEINVMKGHGLKLLILGYKDKGRGHDYLEEHRTEVSVNRRILKDNLLDVMNEDWFKVVCFDNLGLEQLDVKSIVPEEEWEHLYAGDDGTCTFYIDMVSQTFGKSSLVSRDEMMPLMDNVVDMLRVIRNM